MSGLTITTNSPARRVGMSRLSYWVTIVDPDTRSDFLEVKNRTGSPVVCVQEVEVILSFNWPHDSPQSRNVSTKSPPDSLSDTREACATCRDVTEQYLSRILIGQQLISWGNRMIMVILFIRRI